ncbi:hypothetical protein ACHAL6_11660 [Proteiniclasticum sp. C24MP]|uniref:hypothetical protein n=1 Tax=Proteiniclasticum sp. C24MP TaxID=3374101 RepID=UPI0037544D47
MAIDMVRIFISGVGIDALNHKASSWKRSRFYRQDCETKYKKRQEKYGFGTLSMDSGCIHIEYMRYAEKMGDLLLSLSLPDLYFGNNAYFYFHTDYVELAGKIHNELRYAIDVKKLPPWSEWGLSRDELTVDITDTSENNRRRFDTLAKLKKLPYQIADLTYKNEGSIYFHTGKNRMKSGRQLIVYDKSLQQSIRGINLEQTLNLPQGYSVLRVEEKTKGSPLKTDVKKTLANYEFPEGFTRLEIALSKEHQIFHIKSFLSSLGLDRIITTKYKLYAIIDDMSALSRKRKKTCKRVLRYLNGEFKNISLSERTITSYKKIILQTGFHFLYAESDILPVQIEDETGQCVLIH